MAILKGYNAKMAPIGTICKRYIGGEGGIRTLDGLLTHTPLAGERLQPLGHLSVNRFFPPVFKARKTGMQKHTGSLIPGKDLK